MSGAAVRCDYPRNVGRRIAPRYLAVSNLCKVVVRPGNTTGRPQGQAFPQTPCKAFRQCEFVIFRASFLRPFPFRLPTEQCPSFPASLARLLSEARGSGVSLDANTPAQASQLERCNFLRLALFVWRGHSCPRDARGTNKDRRRERVLRLGSRCGSARCG